MSCPWHSLLTKYKRFIASHVHTDTTRFFASSQGARSSTDSFVYGIPTGWFYQVFTLDQTIVPIYQPKPYRCKYSWTFELTLFNLFTLQCTSETKLIRTKECVTLLIIMIMLMNRSDYQRQVKDLANFEWMFLHKCPRREMIHKS